LAGGWRSWRRTEKATACADLATARQRQQEGASVVEMWGGLKSAVALKCCHAAGWSSAPLLGWAATRRLSKDYEFLPQSSEAIIYLAMTRLMLKRLGKVDQRSA
jgi:hypothetical protein